MSEKIYNMVKLEQENDRLKKGIRVLAEAYAEFTGSCPLDMHDVIMDCEKRCDDNQPAKCWQEYFLEEASNGK